MSVDLAEFRTAYLVEVEELILAANKHLLALEAAARRGEHDAKTIREVFRVIHTVKGLSAMVGVEPVVVVAHRLESALRLVDRGRARLGVDAVDVMLAGVREIEQAVRQVAERRVPSAPPASLLERLDTLENLARPAPVTGGEPSLVIDAALASKLSPGELEELSRGVGAGKRVVQIDFAPSPERAEAGNNITSVRERVARLGEIVKVVPRAQPVSPATPGGLVFSLVVLSDAEPGALAAAAGVDSADVRTLAEGSNVRQQELLDESEQDMAGPRHGVVRVDVRRLDDTLERLAALVVSRFRLQRVVAELGETGADVRPLLQILAEQGRQLRDLRAAVLRVRLVRVADMLERVPLLVRGLARATGRQVRLELDVGTSEIDKTVGERIFPAIVHLVRNAVDHAIESPEERVRLGKPESGHLRIRSSARQGGQLELEIADDGRGIDAVGLARKLGHAPPGNDAELLDLMCSPGLSSRDEASATSGRGMGMDIVRRSIVDDLGGELSVSTVAGQGTSFVMRVPLTITIVDAFTFESAGERFCVPVALVDEIVEIEHARLIRPPGTHAHAVELGMLERRGETVPFLHLGRLLSRDAGTAGKALVVRRHGEPTAFAVDRLLGQQEVVIRPLEDPLVRVPGVTGSTDLGDGRLTLVLDPHALAAARSSL